jgi:protein TonB
MAVATGAPQGAAPKTDTNDGDSDYVPQFKVTALPVIPIKEALSKIEYPTLAAKQGIEATVYLELYIDRNGKIVKAVVLKDPGFGFAEASVKGLVGLVCTPAKMNEETTAVRYRFPLRFTLK